MTEEKRQSTVPPEQIQGFNSPAEDEINLIDLLKLMVRKKILFLTVISFCALFSIFYAQSITPVYQATVSFLDPQIDISSADYDLLPNVIVNEIRDSPLGRDVNPFHMFLSNIEAYEVKQEVFVNGGFQKKFFRETGIDTNQSVLAIYNSTKTVEIGGRVYLRLEGYEPKVMLEFLTALVKAAKENVNIELNERVRSTLKSGIKPLSDEIEYLHHLITQQKQIEKEKFSKAITMINKHMGIKNNNFIKPGSEIYPLFWFLYEELGIQTKKIIQKHTTLLAKNELKLKRLQTADLPRLKLNVVTVGEYGYSLAKPNQSWIIVGSGLFFGLFISIVMAFFLHIGKP